MTRPRRVGLPWYEPNQYAELRSTLADGTKLPPDYETWRVATEQMEGEVRRSGVEVVRVLIKPAAFAAWCTQYGVESDAVTRARYADDFLKARGEG
jgi:hypothetical protein